MSYPGVVPVSTNVSQTQFHAPAMEGSGRRSVWSSIGKAAAKACVMPFRIASTVVNGGVFAAYYVTAVAVTGLAATGGAVYGIGKMATDAIRGKPHKSLLEYTIKPARETFNCISRLYYELPRHGSEFIFSGVAVAAVTVLAIVAIVAGDGNSHVWIHTPCCYHSCGDAGGSGHQKPADDDYNPSGLSAVLHPYRPSILLGRKIMGTTTQVLNSGQKVD